jgi:hypothetical protein
MTYFESLLVTLVTFKIIVFLVVFGSWLFPKVKGFLVKHQRLRRRRQRLLQQQQAEQQLPITQRRRKPSRRVSRRESIVAAFVETDWAKVFRGVSMVLFIAYPSVSLKILRLFKVTLSPWNT